MVGGGAHTISSEPLAEPEAIGDLRLKLRAIFNSSLRDKQRPARFRRNCSVLTPTILRRLSNANSILNC